MYYSPLRYPGGKSKLAAFITKICQDNDLTESYVEPYAGGASVALHLIINNIVNHVHINDADRSLFAFWHCLIHDSEKVLQSIESMQINMDSWNYFKLIQKEKDTCDLIDLALSTFFLNRTNRSGILNAGVIGGKDQSGNYKMDCRFNKKDIIKRLERIINLKDKITVTNLDALDLIKQHEYSGNNVGKIAYFDPPYYYKADSLYMNHYQPEDHKLVAEKIKSIRNFHFVISYDDNEAIRSLYSELPSKRYSFSHNIINSRKGMEILFFDKNLIVDDLTNRNPVKFRHNRKKNIIQYIN
ncbi:DNA adenine methylase [Nonlabens ulvanivorans]|uniref:DNA adenine methylase n=1 Tax=Nonlabens ulvanivorans TaxID=906888 RepID=UPI0037C9539C